VSWPPPVTGMGIDLLRTATTVFDPTGPVASPARVPPPPPMLVPSAAQLADAVESTQ
jgi:hypothetical protein